MIHIEEVLGPPGYTLMYLLQKICEDIDDIFLGWPSG